MSAPHEIHDHGDVVVDMGRDVQAVKNADANTLACLTYQMVFELDYVYEGLGMSQVWPVYKDIWSWPFFDGMTARPLADEEPMIGSIFQIHNADGTKMMTLKISELQEPEGEMGAQYARFSFEACTKEEMEESEPVGPPTGSPFVPGTLWRTMELQGTPEGVTVHWHEEGTMGGMAAVMLPAVAALSGGIRQMVEPMFHDQLNLIRDMMAAKDRKTMMAVKANNEKSKPLRKTMLGSMTGVR